MKTLCMLLGATLSLATGLSAGQGPAMSLEEIVQIRAMQRKLGSELPVVSEQSSKKELLLALADAGAQAAARPSQATDATDPDYAAMVTLLQQYRDEIAALGLKQDSLDKAVADLKEKAEQLEERAAISMPDGLQIHGRFLALYDDLLVTGPGKFSGNATRYQHVKQHAELIFQGKQGPFSAMTQLDFINMVGSYWGEYGIRRTSAQLDLPISLAVGDIYQRMSPFTLWRNEDEDPYEPEPFRGRRQRLRDDFYLKDDHAFYLPGVKAWTQVPLYGDLALKVEGIGSIVGNPGTALYFPANAATGATSTAMTTPYTTYFLGWQLEAVNGEAFHLGYLGTRFWDAANTAAVSYGAGSVAPASAAVVGTPIESFDDQVHSGRFGLKLFGGEFQLEGEAAVSRYVNPNVGVTNAGLSWTAGVPNYFADPSFRLGDPLYGSAADVSATVDMGVLRVVLQFTQAAESFVAPAAQARTVDRNSTPYGPFLTENVNFNPAVNGKYGFGNALQFVGVPFAESRINNRIIPPDLISGTAGTQRMSLNYLLPYDEAFNAIQPYGAATPNRRVIGGELGLKLWDGALVPWGKVQMGEQLVGQGGLAPTKYFVGWGGLSVDLRPWLSVPVKLGGDYRLEDTRNSEWVGFDSVRIDMGIEYRPVPTTAFTTGIRHLDYNGTLFSADPAYAPTGKRGISQLYESLGVGLEHRIGDHLKFDVVYSTQVFPNRDLALSQGLEVAYQIEQTFAKVTAEF